jgi:hypothetical protein
MVYQRHVAGFLVFPAGGVRFNLQDLRFFPVSETLFLNKETRRCIMSKKSIISSLKFSDPLPSDIGFSVWRKGGGAFTACFGNIK